MTRKDFELIAASLKASRPDNYLTVEDAPAMQWDATVNDMAQTLSATNARFDRDRFRTACGYVTDNMRKALAELELALFRTAHLPVKCNGEHDTLESLFDCADCMVDYNAMVDYTVKS